MSLKWGPGGCRPGLGIVTDIGESGARVCLALPTLWGTSCPGTWGRGMPFLLLSWAARVKPLDNKADGNLCSGLWERKESSVLFRPGLNTTLRDIFVFTAATPPPPQKPCSSMWRHISPPHTGMASTLAPNPKVPQG